MNQSLLERARRAGVMGKPVLSPEWRICSGFQLRAASISLVGKWVLQQLRSMGRVEAEGIR